MFFLVYFRQIDMEMTKKSASSGKAGTGAPVAESKLALHVEGSHAGVDGAAAQLLLDAQQLVVLCHTLGAAGGAGLDLAGVQSHGQVGDGGVLSLAGAVRADGGIAGLVS